jgi:hypothetical protein
MIAPKSLNIDVFPDIILPQCSGGGLIGSWSQEEAAKQAVANCA